MEREHERSREEEERLHKEVRPRTRDAESLNRRDAESRKLSPPL